MSETKVEKRNGEFESVSFDKITERLYLLSKMYFNSIELNGSDKLFKLADWQKPIKTIDPIDISKKICARIHHGIKTTELDQMAAELCASMSHLHPEYGILAGRICINNMSKSIPESIKNVATSAMCNYDKLGKQAPLLATDVSSFIKKHYIVLDQMIVLDRDYGIDFFGFKTLQRSYLLQSNNKLIERPQHLWMRVAIGIHALNINEECNRSDEEILQNIKETYEGLSCKKFIHATPTLFHAGTPRPQMSSCFLLGTEDSVEGIYDTVKDTALISKWAGGIGIHISNIRANGSYIRKTAGHSLGIMPMLKVYNDTARYINQSGRRNGSFALYLEPWHADIFAFLDAKKNHGPDEERARDLFYALWIPDLFMQRVCDDTDWCLMCPDHCPGLSDCYGDEFNTLYCKYENLGQYIVKIKARDVWKAIISAQIETGTPYMLYKDAVNRCSNQKNVGIIKSSNLCTEIMEYSDSTEYAVCNLASINLTSFVNTKPETIKQIESWKVVNIYVVQDCSWCCMLKSLLRRYDISFTEIIVSRSKDGTLEWPSHISYCKTVPQLFVSLDESEPHHIGGYKETWEILRPRFDFKDLAKIVTLITRNLNRIIDLNFYPVIQTRKSNQRHRPIGIGVQGLADVFQLLRLPFDSQEARELNAHIHETMYYAALTASHELAKQYGRYSTFNGSPLSEGKFQFNLWEENNQPMELSLTNRYDWDELRKDIMTNGVRNSLLIAPMPTASTSQILGNNECFEPFTF